MYTFEKKAKFQGGDSNCRLCSDKPVENIIHIVSCCSAYEDIRKRIFEEIKTTIDTEQISEILKDKELSTQFILDCTSPNLPFRISGDDELFPTILQLSRDLCFGILKSCTEKLNFMLTHLEKNLQAISYL